MQVIQRNRRLTFETYFEIKSIKTIGSLALKVIFISSISVHRRYQLKQNRNVHIHLKKLKTQSPSMVQRSLKTADF